VARARQTKPRSDLPPLQVGSTRAEFVGTNSEGKWVLRLPSGETVLTPPVPNPDNAPVEKHGPVRKVKIRRALPPDEKPPVVALPVQE
jgi:hypothetical protein